MNKEYKWNICCFLLMLYNQPDAPCKGNTLRINFEIGAVFGNLFAFENGATQWKIALGMV